MTPEEAADIIDEIGSLADSGDLPSNAIDFAESVHEKANSIGETIEETGRVSEAQATALENMLAGLQRWFRE